MFAKLYSKWERSLLATTTCGGSQTSVGVKMQILRLVVQHDRLTYMAIPFNKDFKMNKPTATKRRGEEPF